MESLAKQQQQQHHHIYSPSQRQRHNCHRATKPTHTIIPIINNSRTRRSSTKNALPPSSSFHHRRWLSSTSSSSSSSFSYHPSQLWHSSVSYLNSSSLIVWLYRQTLHVLRKEIWMKMKILLYFTSALVIVLWCCLSFQPTAIVVVVARLAWRSDCLDVVLPTAVAGIVVAVANLRFFAFVLLKF